MTIAAVIAEYNPFHQGHAYQLQTMRDNGATHILALMSGHITQRGDFPCYSKWARAQAALQGGADLVLELPAVYACAGAEKFAKGAVRILNALGVVNSLCFGSECGQLEPLSAAAELLEDSRFPSILKAAMSRGESYPKAVAAVLAQTDRSVAATPNNILGIEYMRALRQTNSPIQPITIQRNPAFEPAHRIRQHLYAQPAPDMFHVEHIETAALLKLHTTSLAQWSTLPDVTEGLEHRLLYAARNASTLAQFYANAKTKRYTMARLKRIVACLLLDIHPKDQLLVPYARILGFNQRGRELLATARKHTDIPLTADYARLSRQFPRMTQIEDAASCWFWTGYNQPQFGADYYIKPIII